MNHWIFVETFHNWQVEERNNFEFMGIKENKFRNKNISFGDKIFIYVSKIKKFSDVREVISGKLYDTPSEYNYDREFIKCVKTKSIKILDKEDWLEFSKIIKELEVFTRSTSPSNKLLNAPIKLEYNDQQILKNYFKI